MLGRLGTVDKQKIKVRAEAQSSVIPDHLLPVPGHSFWTHSLLLGATTYQQSNVLW